MSTDSNITVVFDTDCLLCSGWVHFLLRHERGPSTRFVSAWSEEGLALAADHGLSAADLDETYLVVMDGTGLTRSDAALTLFCQLKAPWRWLGAFRAVPRSLRDAVYRLFARNRYRWFGRSAQCFAPPPDQRARFVPGPARTPETPRIAD